MLNTFQYQHHSTNLYNHFNSHHFSSSPYNANNNGSNEEDSNTNTNNVNNMPASTSTLASSSSSSSSSTNSILQLTEEQILQSNLDELFSSNKQENSNSLLVSYLQTDLNKKQEVSQKCKRYK